MHILIHDFFSSILMLRDLKYPYFRSSFGMPPFVNTWEREEFGLTLIKNHLAAFAASQQKGSGGGGSDSDDRCGCRLPCVLRMAKVTTVIAEADIKDKTFVYFQVK